MRPSRLSPLGRSWRGAILLLFFALPSTAQTTFTQHLTRPALAGEGLVTLHQDSDIDALVNGQTRHIASPPQHTAGAAVRDTTAHADSEAAPVTGRRAKATGYRIQVYAGGNNRTSKQEAQRMASLVSSYFSDVPVYTNFLSPRWVCRVGDFRTYEEAHELLQRMRETHRFNEASIVKTQIVVYR